MEVSRISGVLKIQIRGSILLFYRLRIRIQILFSAFQDVDKKYFSQVFFAYFLLEVHLHQFSKITSFKEVPKLYKSSFFIIFFA
jgi:hypothetical protein